MRFSGCYLVLNKRKNCSPKPYSTCLHKDDKSSVAVMVGVVVSHGRARVRLCHNCLTLFGSAEWGQATNWPVEAQIEAEAARGIEEELC